MIKEIALAKLQELDQRLAELSISLKAKEMEKLEFEDKHKAVLAALDGLKQEMKQLKTEIEAVKAEMLSQYILGNIEHPFLGARHSIRTIKDVEVINKALVPEDYKDVNLVLVRKDAISKNVIIPGIQVIEKKIIAFK
jgi:seryl-tRNA synthetase